MLGLEVENLSYRYQGNNQLALDTVNLKIEAGSCLGLIGPNGAGKSTLLSILSGLLAPSNGSIKFTQQDQSNPFTDKFIKQHIALVPQEYAFYSQLKVRQNLEYFVSLCALNTKQQQQTIERVIQQCQLQEVLDTKTSALSGGFKRRVNLAIALLKDPQILFLDEPTVGVDPVSRNAILTLINCLKRQGKTIIFTSHMLSEIQSHCDQIFILKQGRAIYFEQDSAHKSLQISFSKPVSHTLITELNSDIENTLQPSNTLRQNSVFTCNISSERVVCDIIQFAEKHKIEIESLQYGKHSLTEHYLKLMAQDDFTEH
ncbi:ABC transporter ATP-binding protein [Paraglaciecola aquimarina]|uniref:ABC transporter ATP-binding protein n=1 Tax=Paraglaciecola aquimarina TaxID=1235557 RepID=A0ABU3SSR7_9ALTE|nr:ABC transporter ATP-binding protein [Paraglaciecola aquimarina]MDU0353035.1 ABC transporter ATP-binding protein [Paraglaciecola aquimarina]